ncbi:MAG: hypothetical protein IT431_01690 [Phycisphaerales bacterium]|nr:hypothetical protein [Phycisphaerales bacterium]
MIARMLRLGVLTLPAAAAAAALEQGTMTFFWTTDDTGDRDGVIEPGEDAVFTLWAGIDPSPPVGFAGSIFDIAGDAEYQAGTLRSYTKLIDSGWDQAGDDNSIRGIECFQLPPLFNPDFVADNPIAIYRIEWRPDGYTPGSVGFWSENHQNADVYTDELGSSEGYDIVIEPGSMRIVPAPGGGLLLALGCAGWRRRR